MTSAVLLQSFRTRDVPQWVIRCQHSAHAYAQARGWAYQFMDDALFDFAPAWVRDTLTDKPPCTLSDICRLEWMKHSLQSYETVIWVDIDVLVFDARRIRCDTTLPHGFAYESYADAQGVHQGINNAFMFFNRSSPLLDDYLSRCYELISRARASKDIDRTAMGPDLLQSLGITPTQVIRGLNILNFNAIQKIYHEPDDRGAQAFLERGGDHMGAANLCLNERSFFSADQQPLYDSMLDQVAKRLLAMGSCPEAGA